MRFPMTLGGITRVITFGTLLILLVMLPLQFFVVLAHVPVAALKVPVAGVLVMVSGALLFTIAVAPRAVKVSSSKLTIERLFWRDFEVPLRLVTGVEEGPVISMMGKVRRVVGNGGLMGFTGLYHVAEVGMVRCWATRLGVPTVLVRRGDERPLLLGVDDPAGLLQALRRATRQG